MASRPVVLCVISGWGEREATDANAVAEANTPVLDDLRARHPVTTLAATGHAVGLDEGEPGQGEAGYLTLGAGRPVPSDRLRVNETIRNRKLSRVPMVDQAVRICLYDECALHLIGLVSNGHVHARMEHLEALVELAWFHELPIRVHAILDGRDTPRHNAMDHLRRLQGLLEDCDGQIATVSGRGYAMACDGRWDLTYQAFHAIVRDKELGPAAPHAESAFEAIHDAVNRGLPDDWVPPTRLGDYRGLAGDYTCDFGAARPIWQWSGEDVGIATNLRGDRMRQLTAMLTRRGIPEEVADDLLMDRVYPVHAFPEHCFLTLTDYGEDLDLPVLFPTEPVDGTLAQVLSEAGLEQVRCVETEAAHKVTRAFNGRRVQPLTGETRRVVPSPRTVERWTEKPAMSTEKVARLAVEAIRDGEAGLVLADFVAPDALAHTGEMTATVQALEAVDAALGTIVEAAREAGAPVLVTSTHGNCEHMSSDTGEPSPAHTVADVPFIFVGDAQHGLRPGTLADVAPTVLELLDLAIPSEMTGRSLLDR